MLDNDFILETNLKFDLEKMMHACKYSIPEKNLLPYQRTVENFEYFSEIRKTLPILGSIWNIYDFKSNFLLDKHTDSARKSTLNIPVKGGEDSITTFYKCNKIPGEYRENQRLYSIKEDLEEIFNFTLKTPTIMRTDIPHSVRTGHTPRLIVSWGLICDFEEAKKFLKDG